MSTPAPQLFQQLKGHFSTSPSTVTPPNQVVADSSDFNDQIDMSSIAQAIPLAVQESTDSLNPSFPISSAKERVEASISLERPTFDQVAEVQQVEQEKSMEISPEVESFIAQVGEHPNQLPQEIVIADQSTPVPTTKYLARPVIVLPITPEVEKTGANKAAQFSIRWLVEWSRKMMKTFSGQVIYREVTTK